MVSSNVSSSPECVVGIDLGTTNSEIAAYVDGRVRVLGPADRSILPEEYEGMIRPLVESTLESVTKALEDAGKRPCDLDAILLVGGATCTPMITRLFQERCGLTPRQDVHPDLAVALGAGVLASRVGGHEIERVLVDASPYSFGPSYMAERDGFPYPHCYHPIIHRNTPLPVTREEKYATASVYQKVVELQIYQGDNPDALKNILVGDFRVDGLTPIPEPNEVLCRMSLDLDGILHVTAIEKRTGLSKHIAITGALQIKSEKEIAAARQRLEELFASRNAQFEGAFAQAEEGWDEDGRREDDEEGEEGEDAAQDGPLDAEDEDREDVADVGRGDTPEQDPRWTQAVEDARVLLSRSRDLLQGLHDDDREEAVDLHEKIEASIESRDMAGLAAAKTQLREMLFFIEGR